MVRCSRRHTDGANVGLAVYVGVCCGITVCLTLGFYWLMQPTRMVNPGLAAYHAAKHGVLGLTKTAALEYAARGIRINAVCPGSIDTPMAHSLTGGDPEVLKDLVKLEPIGRLGKPEEIAAAVLWLCSPGASYVIGHPLLVDGGYTAQ